MNVIGPILAVIALGSIAGMVIVPIIPHMRFKYETLTFEDEVEVEDASSD
jgi:hypothetical protein